jgi:hypothetical protein
VHCHRNQNLLRHRQNLFDGVSDDTLLEWCNHDPTKHYPLVVSVAVLFKGRDESEATGWQPLVGELLKRAPEPRLVLNEIVQRLYPSMWSGSLATVLEQRKKLLNSLPGIEEPDLAATVAEVNARLQKTIEAERQREKEEDRARNNRFE